MDTRIYAFSCRGHGFRFALDCPVAFTRDLVHVLFEPDAAAAEAMAVTSPNADQVHVVPLALGDADRDADLHLTANPAFGSLRAPSAPYLSLSREVRTSGEWEGASVDEVFYDAENARDYRVTGKSAVKVRSLDAVLRQGALPVSPPPDVLTLDLPGTEYEALAGAGACLADSTLAVVTGVDFLSRYEGQRLFGDVHGLLVNAGFRFAGFSGMETAAPQALPVGLRAEDFPAHAKAVFLRRLDALGAASPAERHVRCLKLAFLAVNFGQVAAAFEALRAAEASPPDDATREALAGVAYPRFLRQMQEAAATMPGHALHADEQAALKAIVEARTLARRIRQMPPVQGWYRRKFTGLLRRLRRAWIVLMGGIPSFASPQMVDPDAEASKPAPTTDFEELLLRFGFWTVAEKVRRRRAQSHPYLRQG